MCQKTKLKIGKGPLLSMCIILWVDVDDSRLSRLLRLKDHFGGRKQVAGDKPTTKLVRNIIPFPSPSTSSLTI